jgi:fatty-acyl-CoA synthase
MYDRLLAVTDDAVPFPAFKFGGSARFNSELADIWERADARGMCLIGLYGMSEVQAFYAGRDPRAPLEERKRTAGRPFAAGARARVRDVETGEILGPGQDGELEMIGPSLMREYYGAPEATAAAFTEDGYLKSGDLARMEPDGGFEFLARMGDTLRLGGFLVAPAEIEAHLVGHPDVAAAQAVGVPTAAGTRVVAFVVAADGAGFDEAALARHCARDLAKFKVPVRIFAIDAFPVTESANGVKIQKTKLRDMALARLA